MRRWALLLLLVAAPLAGADASPHQQIRQGKKDLRHLKGEYQNARKQFQSQARAEQSVLKQLAGLNGKVDASRRDLRTFEHNLQVVEERIATLGRLGQGYQSEVAANRVMLARELRLMQRAGALGEVRLLLSAKEPAELISRYRFLKTLARQNASRVKATRDKLAKVEEFTREHKARELQLVNDKANIEAARRRAEGEKKSRAALLNSIRAKKDKAQGLMKELAESAQNLQSKLNEFQRQAAEAARAAQESRAEDTAQGQAGRHGGSIELDGGPSRLGRHHSLPWPVRGPLVQRFGEQMHPKFHTKVFNRGIEIAAPLGSPVLAIADGTAKYADYFEGYGQMVILDHGGNYFSIYGHNSQLSIKEGMQVKRGEPIAEVGDSSTSGRSSLYFEIRYLAKAVDPLLWLNR